MVADPDTGHLYVSERINARISEFTVWGAFVKAWGWDVAPEGTPGDTVSNQFEVCTTSCQAGVKGNGVGQFDDPEGITVDVNGDIYVHDVELNRRVQKFSPSGQFLLMFGGGVNQGPTNPGNLCTAQHITEGDTCGAGTSGTADGQFSNATAGNYITYNPVTDSLFVGDKDRIQEFATHGTFSSKIDFEVSGELEAFDGTSVRALAAEPVSGDLYLAIAPFNDGGTLVFTPDVYRFDPSAGEVTDTLEVAEPGALAVDVKGNVYVAEVSKSPHEVLGFNPSGNCIEGMCAGDDFADPVSIPNSSGGSPFRPDIQGFATNVAGPGSKESGNLYVNYFSDTRAAYLNSYGLPPIAFEDPPSVAPEIRAQYATSVDTDGALLKAEINPRFWPDATYYVQYGSEECVKAEGWEAGCVSEEPGVPGTLLTAKSLNSFFTAAGVFLAGLAPDTTYLFRFVAESGGGGPVYGIDPDGEGPLQASLEDGLEASFHTFAEADPPETGCTNQAFRIGPGAKLPDCRAYEMVSPLEKGNGDIRFDSVNGLHQSSTSGDGLAYSSSTSFGDSEAAPSTAQYLAKRDPTRGWLSKNLSPPRTRAVGTGLGKLENEFKSFSPDLCSAWLRTVYDPPLADNAVSGYFNLYRRENCAPKGDFYEALTTVGPEAPTDGYDGLELQGLSADGSRAIFIANDRLVEGVPSPDAECLAAGIACNFQLYERDEGGQLRFVCILPNGSQINPATHSCYAGTTGNSEDAIFGGGREGSRLNAYSADGKRIFWSASQKRVVDVFPKVGLGRIYVRIDPDLEVEGDEETVAVSQSTGSGADAFYWGADDDGARAIFEISEGPLADNLYSFEVDEKEETLIAKGVLGVLGQSEDATRVYFASTEVIAGSGQNGEGDEAEANDPNLYLYEQGELDSYRFIGTLSDIDTGSKRVSPISDVPLHRTSRVSVDGLQAAFLSTASLTGYDNIDAVRGIPASEVFVYDAKEDELRCISCNPSGVRPSGGELLDGRGTKTGIPAAGQIPGWERSLYASRLLAEDGTHLFFESFEALVLHDTNGVKDVYRWVKEGSDGCDSGDSTFSPEAGGCVELISSGESPAASHFRDASPDGEDVFFSTLSSLLPQDYGLIDIYDARVGGGFPQSTDTPGCEGEACQGPLTTPDDPTPGSSSFDGAGNVTGPPRPTKCAKGRRAVRKAGKTRCVKKPRKAKRAKRANTTRGATR